MIHKSIVDTIKNHVKLRQPENNIRLFMICLEETEKFSHILCGEEKKQYCIRVLMEIGQIDSIVNEMQIDIMISDFFNLVKLFEKTKPSCKKNFLCFRT
jgi:hypothetical protein